MKIYFYNNKEEQAKKVNTYLKQVGVEVMTDTAGQKAEGDIALNKADALLVLVNSLDAQAGYLIALALSQNKDVLCLLPEGKSLDATLKNLQKDNNFAKKLNIEFYQEDNLIEKISSFLQSFAKDDIKELFNIKYTLRVSNKINDYLNWKSKQKGVRKADWLRDKIKDIIEEDKEYQEFIKNKFQVK